MRTVVVLKKIRPHIHDKWSTLPFFNTICKTMIDCWEREPDARLTANCVVERLQKHIHLSHDTFHQFSEHLEFNDIKEKDEEGELNVDERTYFTQNNL